MAPRIHDKTPAKATPDTQSWLKIAKRRATEFGAVATALLVAGCGPSAPALADKAPVPASASANPGAPIETATPNNVETPAPNPIETDIDGHKNLPTPDEFLAMAPEQQAELLRTPESALASRAEYVDSIENALNIAYNSHTSYEEYARIKAKAAQEGKNMRDVYPKELVDLTFPLVKQVMQSMSPTQEAAVKELIENVIAINAAEANYPKHAAANGLETNDNVLKAIATIEPYKFTVTITPEGPELPVDNKTAFVVDVTIQDNLNADLVAQLYGGEPKQLTPTSEKVLWVDNEFSKHADTAYPARQEPPRN